MIDLFFDEEEAIAALKERGYRVVKEEYPTAGSVTTVKDLVNYFYSRRYYYNTDRKFPYSIDYSNDSRDISSLIQSRQKLGLGRKAAVAEAALIVEALFRFEEHLHLKTPIRGPAILTSRPLVDRVCSFMNNEDAEVGEDDTKMFIEEVNELYRKEYAQRDFEQASEERKRILEKLDGERQGERIRDSESSPECD